MSNGNSSFPRCHSRAIGESIVEIHGLASCTKEISFFAAMWDASARGTSVVILSGDRHEFGATAFPPPKGGKWPLGATVHEFSCSPLNQFYIPTRSYFEVNGKDEIDEIRIKYVPDGNLKFGAVEVEGISRGEQGLLRYRLFVDGVGKWQYILTTPPAVECG